MVEEMIKKSLSEAIGLHKQRAVIMLELPEEVYFEANSASVKYLTAQGFDGLYISFQRPFKNISSVLTQHGVDVERLLFIDVATAFAEEMQEENLKCVSISSGIDIDELVRSIYTSIPRLKSKKRFIFIDSLTTITLYKPLSETMRFSEFLMRMVKKNKEDLILVFNVASNLAQKKFIKDIAMNVDEVISVAE